MRKFAGFIISSPLAGLVVAIYILFAALAFNLNRGPSPISLGSYLLVVIAYSAIGGYVASIILFPIYALLARARRLSLLTAVIAGIGLCVAWYSSIGAIVSLFGFREPQFLPFSLTAALYSNESRLFTLSLVTLHTVVLSLFLARFSFRVPLKLGCGITNKPSGQ